MFWGLKFGYSDSRIFSSSSKDMDFLDQGGVCGQCGVALTDVPNTPIEARIGCPSCGSTSRAIAVHLKETIQLSDYLSALQERKGEAVGFSESERQGRSSSATFQNDGWVDIAVIGSSPQGEEDTRAACQILKERLNAGGDNWDRIVAGREAADCVLVDREDPKRTLEIQVRARGCFRRPMAQPQFGWIDSPCSLSRRCRVGASARNREKGTRCQDPGQLRTKLLLALDATRLPGLAFDAIVREFLTVHRDSVRRYGFAAIWLVGPLVRLVWRLD